MFRYYLFVLSFLWQSGLQAQGSGDSLFLELSQERMYVRHEIHPGETIFSIAELYNVPAIVLGQNNDLSFHESLQGRTRLLIPLGSYNFRQDRTWPGASYRPLYYKRQHATDHQVLPGYLGVSNEVFAAWNQQLGGPVLMAGWIEYHAATVTTAAKESGIKVTTTTAPVPAPAAPVVHQPQDTLPKSDHELMYDYQTEDGAVTDSLSGTVVFFQSQTKVSDKLYAFCNDIPKGRVVKITNPSTGRFVFARILGPMPTTKLYHNALIGVDSRAQQVLGVREIKLWCKLYYK